MNIKTITLRCKDEQEAVVFHKYKFDLDGSVDYEINVEDSYIGKNYRGFFGRIKKSLESIYCQASCLYWNLL